MMSRVFREKIETVDGKLIVLTSCIAVTNDDILKVQTPETE